MKTETDFNRAYRKARKDGNGIDCCIVTALCQNLGVNAATWRWNLQQEVHLNRSLTLKGLCRRIYLSAHEQSFFPVSGG